MSPPEHYYSKNPDSRVRLHTLSESLRRHLYIFKTSTGVFSFKKLDLGTRVFIENMDIPEHLGTYLDIGCGYGPIGIVLAYMMPESMVYLTEINKRALWCAKENVRINLPDYKKQIRFLEGSYFEPIEKKELKFDGIYTNPPLRQGRKGFLHVCDQMSQFLNPGGTFQFVIKKKMGAPYILEYLSKTISTDYVEILCKRSGYWVFKCTYP